MTATHQSHRGHARAVEISETVLRFGPTGELVGIASRPPGARPGTQAVVILNAGVIHRVGPHRLHVVLARQLARLGVPSLRLDLGGIGDSVASSAAITFRESAVADTRLALDGFGADRYVLFGICAGADNALATALADERVAAVVLVDPHVYPSRRAYVRAAWQKLRELGPRETLARAATAARRLAKARLAPAAAEDEKPGREPPPLAEFGATLGTLVARGVKIFAVFSGAHGPRYNHRDQLFEVFPELRGKVDRAFFPDANHTFTELAAQSELVAATTAWIARRGP